MEGDPDEILQIDTYNAQITAIKAVQDLIKENRVQQLMIEDQDKRILKMEKENQELKEKLNEIIGLLKNE